MNIRLEKANEGDFKRVQDFIIYTQYHWLVVVTSVEDRKKSIKKANCPPKPRFGKYGRKITAAEKYATYTEKDYLRKLEEIKAEKGEVLIILNGDDVIGFVYWRPELKNRRIVEFPLEFKYQNVRTIRAITNELVKRVKPEIKLFVIHAGAEGEKLLKGTPIYYSRDI